MTINISGIENDISLETASRAFYNMSHSPEKRGASVVSVYIKTIGALANFIADNDKNGQGQQVFDDLRQKYLRKTLDYLAAQSRCASPMITGPARFPVERNNKAMASMDKKCDAMIYLHHRLQTLALRGLQPVICQEANTETFAGLKVVRNKDVDRLQLLFSGKPSDTTRDLLKKNGFKWSPRFTAWQRQLTENAEKSLQRLMPLLTEQPN
jgi:hypothetical protein